MASRIITKKGSGAPLASDLVHGELAVDTVNKRLYTENAGGTIIELGTAPSTIDINSGTIDGTVIGGSSAAAGTFTSITGTSANINGTVTADGLTVDTAIDTTGITINTPYGTAGEQYAALRWNNSSFAGGDSEIRNVVDGSTSLGSSLEFHTEQTGTGTLTERLKLHNNGDISFYEDTGTTPKFFWDASAESLGIGTTSPATALDVNGTVTADGLTVEGTSVMSRFRTGSATDGRIEFAYNTTDIGYINMQSASVFDITARSGVDLSLGAGGSERMRLDSSGNVGIGNTSPSYKLSVGDGTADTRSVFASNNAFSIGVSNASGFAGWIGGSGVTDNMVFSNSGGTERMRIDSSGNVGIGTTSPAAKLEIGGAGEGIILASPDGTRYKITVANGGILIVTAV